MLHENTHIHRLECSVNDVTHFANYTFDDDTVTVFYNGYELTGPHHGEQFARQAKLLLRRAIMSGYV